MANVHNANANRRERLTFTRWCNTFLVDRNKEIEDLVLDLQDGVKLFSLLEILSGEEIQPKVNKRAKLKVQKIENINFCLKFIRDQKIKLVNISAEDVYEQKKKLILGLIWTLILRFQIQQVTEEDDGKSGVKKDLLEWCNRVLNPQGEHIDNFTKDWQSGAAFQGLINYCRGTPEYNLSAIDCGSREGKEAALSDAFDKAEEYFQFPQLLDAVDVLDEPDELSIMTYVSYFRGYKTENTACAALSVAYGRGLKAAKTHREAGYTVELKNDEGERVKVGGTSVTGAMVLDGERTKVDVKDNGDGAYTCTYEVAKPGTYELVVLCEGQHIKDSPFAPVVEPSEAFADECTAEPPTPIVAGEECSFVVQTRDASGNNKPNGGEEIAATLGSDVTAAVKDNEDGTYTVTYTAEKAGDFPLTVALKEANIKGSPFDIKVLPANPDASQSTAEGDGIATADTDSPATFKVMTRDRFCNECIEGGFKLVATLAGQGELDGRSVDVTVTDNGDGTYGAEYQPEKAGTYKLAVVLNGANIKDAPFTVTVAPNKATASTFIVRMKLHVDPSKFEALPFLDNFCSKTDLERTKVRLVDVRSGCTEVYLCVIDADGEQRLARISRETFLYHVQDHQVILRGEEAEKFAAAVLGAREGECKCPEPLGGASAGDRHKIVATIRISGTPKGCGILVRADDNDNCHVLTAWHVVARDRREDGDVGEYLKKNLMVTFDNCPAMVVNHNPAPFEVNRIVAYSPRNIKRPPARQSVEWAIVGLKIVPARMVVSPVLHLGTAVAALSHSREYLYVFCGTGGAPNKCHVSVMLADGRVVPYMVGDDTATHRDMHTSAYGTSGQSGAPVLNRDYNVVGVLIGGVGGVHHGWLFRHTGNKRIDKDEVVSADTNLCFAYAGSRT